MVVGAFDLPILLKGSDEALGSVSVNFFDIEPKHLAFSIQHAADRGHRSALIGMDEFLDVSPGFAT